MLLNGGELEGKRLIKRDTLALMTSNQIGNHMVFGILKYGLGFGLVNLPTPGDGNPVLDSYFWAGAYSTNFWVDPRRDIFGIVMTQVVPITHRCRRNLLQQGCEQGCRELKGHAAAFRTGGPAAGGQKPA